MFALSKAQLTELLCPNRTNPVGLMIYREHNRILLLNHFWGDLDFSCHGAVDQGGFVFFELFDLEFNSTYCNINFIRDLFYILTNLNLLFFRWSNCFYHIEILIRKVLQTNSH